MITIFDLDYTLFDADRFKRKGLAKIFGISESDFLAYYKGRFKDQGINYDPMIQLAEMRISHEEKLSKVEQLKLLLNNINDYLFPDAINVLDYYSNLSEKLVLATHGDSHWQKQKIRGLVVNNKPFEDYFNEIIFAENSKSENNQLLKYVGEDISIINDNAKECLELKKLLGESVKVYLVEGPYSNNIEYREKIWKLGELIGR